MSREEFADAINQSLSELFCAKKNLKHLYVNSRWVGAMERGERRWTGDERRTAMRAVTGVASDEDLGLYPQRDRVPDDDGSDHFSEAGRLGGLGTVAPTDLELSGGRLPGVAVAGDLVRPPVDAGLSRRPAAADDDDTERGHQLDASTPADVLLRVGSFVAHSRGAFAREADYRALVTQLVEWAQKMKRRDILQWLSSAAAAAAAAPVLDGLDIDEQDRVVRALACPERVDATVISHIEGVLWRCMRQDDTLGPQAALDTALAQRNLVSGLLPSASGPLRNKLLSLHANLSRFAGWLSFDLGNYAAATEYYENGRSVAHEAHDTELGAFVLCNMSHLATWQGQPRTGIDHALAALGWASQTGDNALKAYAWDVAARAYAMDRQEQAALNAVDEARRNFAGQSASASERSHVYFYSHGQLSSTQSVTHLYLGQPEAAIKAAEAALGEISGSFVRNLALTSLYLGISHTRSSKVDPSRAAKAFTDAARLAAHNRSPRLIQQLRRGWTDLEPWKKQPDVAAARRSLAVYGIL